MKRVVLLAAMLAVLTTALPAGAYPYKLYAKYWTNPNKTDAPTYDRVELPAFNPSPKPDAFPQTPAFVPTGPSNAMFVGVFIAVKTDDIARIELERLDAIYVDVRNRGNPNVIEHTKISRAELMNGTEKQVLDPGSVSDGAVNKLEIHVLLHFEGRFLCEKERQLRASNATAIKLQFAAPPRAGGPRAAPAPVAGPAPTADETNASILRRRDGKVALLSYATLFEQGLETSRHEPIIYSYCNDVRGDIDYAEYAKKLSAAGTAITADELHKREKKKLQDLVMPSVSSLGGYGNIHLRKYRDDRYEHTYGEFKHFASLVRNLPGIEFKEIGAKTRPLDTVLDKNSTVVMVVKPNFCSLLDNCHQVLGMKLSAAAKYTDEDGKETTTTASLKAYGGGWIVADDLEQHIYSKVEFSVFYSLDGGTRIVALQAPITATVENLGLITTFPAVSEVAGVINGAASEANNSSARSSIPLSYAIDLGSKTRGAAVTLPWMMGINVEGAPRLAQYIAIFPHVSAIMPLSTDSSPDEDTSPRVSLGAGIALAKAFTFSVAWPLKGDTDTFLLLGVSATDLADTFKLLK